MRTISLLLTVMLLAACGTVYKAPSSGPMATLILPSEAVVSFFDDDTCSNMQRVGEHGEEAVAIPAGQPIHLSARRANEALFQVCALTVVFTPEAGATYVVTHSGLSPECRSDLLRVLPDGVTHEAEPTARPFRMSGYCSVVYEAI